jgi:hypothetical protein
MTVMDRAPSRVADRLWASASVDVTAPPGRPGERKVGVNGDNCM